MTVNGSLAYTHYRCNTGKRHSVRKTQFHDAACLRRDVIVYQAVNPGYGLLIRPIFTVVLLIVKEITVDYALMDPAVADMVETTVPDRSEQITCVGKDGPVTVEQRCKHIMDDVARKITVMQKCLGQPVHLRIMRFE